MSERISEKQRIALLKERCDGERLIFAKQAEVFMPNAKKVAAFGVGGFAVAKALPVLKPIAIQMTQRTLTKAKIGSAGWLKIAAVISVGIALSRLLSRPPNRRL